MKNRGFYVIIEEPTIKVKELKVRRRIAIRAIIMKGENILLVHTNKGDYKFPGGGLEKDESVEEGLKREVKEETGYLNCEVKERLGTIIQRSFDEYEEYGIFEMVSHYYVCELTDEKKSSLTLDEYEAELNFKPEWVSLEKAIKENEIHLKRIDKNGWVERENFVLSRLKETLSG